MALQDDNLSSQAQIDEYERLIGYDVEDKDGKKVGNVESVWEDHAGQPAFLGIRTGWLGLGRIHVVPAHYATYTEKGRRIRIPFDEEVIKGAPAFDAEYEFTEDGEARLYEYYRGRGMDTSFYDQGRSPSTDLDSDRMRSSDDRDWSADSAREAGSTATAEDRPAATEDRSALGETVDKVKDMFHGDRTESRTGDIEGERTIPLSEEKLDVRKRQVEAGGVRLRKVIRTETVNQPVELQHEEIEIERVPAGASASAAGDFREEDIFIPLRREELDVSKRAQVREEVRISKRTESESAQVRETLRKEDVEVDRKEDEGDRIDR